MNDKLKQLRETIQGMGRVLVAFSGGVDSTFLLKVAHDVLGDDAMAVTAVSESYPRAELEESRVLARSIGARQLFVETGETDREDYRENSPDRCYFCKSELFEHLDELATTEEARFVLYGEIADDKDDHRPGARAAKEHRVRAPLAEVALSKHEIRLLSREMGLSTWDKPAFACLASRVPHGTEVTKEKLSQIERAEDLLRHLGFRQFRVRHHGDIARIELAPEEIGMAAEPLVRSQIVESFREIGFRFTALDLAGYRSGNLNPVTFVKTSEAGANSTRPLSS